MFDVQNGHRALDGEQRLNIAVALQSFLKARPEGGHPFSASAPNLSRRALSHSRSLVVAHRKMIEIRDLPSRRVNELRDVRHLRELDLADLIGQVVIVAMETRRVEDDWNPLRRVAVMIAPR